MLFARVIAVVHPEFLGAYHAAIAARQAHRFAAGLVDQAHDILLHLAGQHPLDHFHGFFVGHAHALNELALFTQAVERRFNLRPAAVHHHRVHADQFEQDHIFGKVGLQGRVGHGVAAVLDDQRFAMKLANVRQRLRKDFGLVTRANVGEIGFGHGRAVVCCVQTQLCRSRGAPSPISSPVLRGFDREIFFAFT